MSSFEKWLAQVYLIDQDKEILPWAKNELIEIQSLGSYDGEMGKV